ncbi:MAG TPA: PA2779 family protein [Burkholderiaceae bacterium]|nr:PA2779 family protein [Burkholderiaceae bacterium]
MRKSRSLNATRGVAAAVAVSLTLGTIPMPTQAQMIPTERAVSVSEQREQIQQLLARADVVQQLEALGVDPGVAKDRVAALSDSQIEQLAAGIDGLPAGGINVLAAVLIVALVLLITDLLGVTTVYPFVRR